MIRIVKNKPYTPKDREKWVKETKKDKPSRQVEAGELVIAEPV